MNQSQKVNENHAECRGHHTYHCHFFTGTLPGEMLCRNSALSISTHPSYDWDEWRFIGKKEPRPELESIIYCLFCTWVFQVGSFFWSVCIHRILWERTNPFFPASGSTPLNSVRVASASSKVRVQSRAHMHIQWCNHAPLTEMSNHMTLFLFY